MVRRSYWANTACDALCLNRDGRRIRDHRVMGQCINSVAHNPRHLLLRDIKRIPLVRDSDIGRPGLLS
jgi:hypothetical protein